MHTRSPYFTWSIPPNIHASRRRMSCYGHDSSTGLNRSGLQFGFQSLQPVSFHDPEDFVLAIKKGRC